MRRMILATAVVLTAIGAPPSASAQSNTFTVDCNRGQKIAVALEHGDFRKPIVINLRGTCREFVTITRDNVTLRGDPAAELLAPAQNADLVTIEARGVTLDSLTLTGGRYGVRNSQGLSVSISHCVIQGTSSDGLRGFVGDARLMNTTVRNAGGAGVYLSRGASVGISEDSHIVGNAGAGIHAERNSTVVVSASEISGNGSNGVQLQNGSFGSVSSSVIEGNGTDDDKPGAGIAISQSQAGMLNNNTIRYNREDGVIVTAGGIATLDDNTIAENGQHGVNAYLGSLLVLHGNVISDNRYSGVVGYAHATVQIGGATIRDNRGGAGISMMYGSKLMLEAPTTISQGNFGALWCGDHESSVNDLSLLDAGGDTVFCTGY
ncbi:MAG: Right handed beta helix region [Deltaproteobacteria bacterium]|nr:Right handed beta helix region [Deltaproteobacteria bacterium]